MKKDLHKSGGEAILRLPNGSTVKLPVYKGSMGPDVIDIRQLGAARLFHLRPGLHVDCKLLFPNNFHRRGKGTAAARRLRDRGSGEESLVSGCRLPAFVRRTADAGAESGLRRAHHHGDHGQRERPGHAAGTRFERAPDAGAHFHDRRDVGLLSRAHRHQRSRRARGGGGAADRQAAYPGGDELQVQHRQADNVSAEFARLCRELPVHDVRDPVRAVQGRPHPGPGARDDHDPACRSRAERLDFDGAGWPARPMPVPLPASRPGWRRCGGRRTAAPTRRC